MKYFKDTNKRCTPYRYFKLDGDNNLYCYHYKWFLIGPGICTLRNRFNEGTKRGIIEIPEKEVFIELL